MNKLAVFGGLPVRNEPINYGKQYIDEEDIKAVEKVLKSDFLTCGPEITRLENQLCKKTNAGYAVAVANGTAALHGACIAAGIENGDEVITTPMTFAASANCVLYCGGIPVFADIDPKTWNICPKSIREKITNKTKAIIAVDFAGQAVEIEEIIEICREHNLILIEDASHSIGTIYDGNPIGGVADITTFSFHPVKTITGGEGGAILTNNKEYYDKLLRFRAHGITREAELFENTSNGVLYHEQIELGYNYRVTDIQAALITSQLNKLDVFSKRRKEIVNRYNKAFSQMEEVEIQKEIEKSDTTRHLYILKFNLQKIGATRKEIYDALYGENIRCNIHYIPVYYHPYYKRLGYSKGLCPNAEKLYEEILSIPLYFSLSDEDVDSVIHGVKKVVDFYIKGI